MPFLTLLGAILLTVFLSYQIMHTLARANRSYFLFRILLLPGVVIHEMSHLMACWLTNTPVEGISFWQTHEGGAGGHVVHHKPKLPLVQPIISFAPFPVGVILLVILSRFLTGHDWYFIAGALFLMLSVGATLAPSKADVIPAIEGVLLLSVLIGGVVYFIPAALEPIAPTINQFQTQLLIVDGLMAAMWLTLLTLIYSVRSIRR